MRERLSELLCTRAWIQLLQALEGQRLVHWNRDLFHYLDTRHQPPELHPPPYLDFGGMRALDDIADPEAYVAAAVRREFPNAPRDEHEELVGAVLAYVGAVAAELPPGASLLAAVRPNLARRIHDAWRKLHPEYRRNTRAGTATMLAAPTGLAHESSIGAAAADQRAGLDDFETMESRLALLAIRSPQDLRKHFPQLLETLGQPSHAPPGTVAAIELFAEIEAERNLFNTGVAPFKYFRGL
jgi:hypothetical protein